MHRGGTWRLDHRVNRQRKISRFSRAEVELKRLLGHRRLDLVLHPRGFSKLEPIRGNENSPVEGLDLPLIASQAPSARVPLAQAVDELVRAIATPQKAQRTEMPRPCPDVAGKQAYPAE